MQLKVHTKGGVQNKIKTRQIAGKDNQWRKEKTNCAKQESETKEDKRKNTEDEKDNNKYYLKRKKNETVKQKNGREKGWKARPLKVHEKLVVVNTANCVVDCPYRSESW